jgi:two-component system sensor histidine kinase QseC
MTGAPRPPWLSSLRLRLLIALVFVFGLGAAAMVGLLRADAVSANEAIEEQSVETQAKDLLVGLRLSPTGYFVSLTIPPAWRSAYRTPEAGYFTLYDARGRSVARSSNLAAPLAYRPSPPGQAISPLRFEGPRQNLALSARGPGGFQLMVARTSPGRLEAVDPDSFSDIAPTLVFIVCAVLGLAGAWGVALLSLRPLVRASREAAAIGPDSPSARLSEAALPMEVRPLVHAVNAALDRVAEAYEGEKRFTADAAHALRTPLAVLDLRLQRAEAGGSTDWADVRRDLAELARLVSGLLSLSRAEQAGPQQRRAVNLARIARETAAAFGPRLEAAGRQIEVRAPQDAPLACADVGALRDMIGVLIDNALTHGKGRIAIDIETPAGEGLILRVSDKGPGVAEAAREDVFQRFHKLDANTPGAGLGLAIARQTARNQGGDAVFVAAATVEVRLRG